jgi:hypothetical protein
MANLTDEAVKALEAGWPAWQIWTVPTWDGQKRATIWCAGGGTGSPASPS